ncbi:MAG TPA: biotin/lipoyl-containing protein [Acidobacteriaceae bacterium]|nr:biotin/lipoyl-containing protein [Acidobacteriaceae bacterium]
MKFDLEIDGQTRKVDISPSATSGQWQMQIDGEPVEADACLLRPGVLSLLVHGQSHRVVLDADLANASANGDSADPALHLGAHRIEWRAEDPRSFRRRRRHAGTDGPITLKASMPGRVVRILVAKGDTVAAHQSVLVLEAMKMQNELKSPKEGRVIDLRVAPGDTVSSGQPLAIVE